MLLEEVTIFLNTVPFVSENSHNTGSTLFLGGEKPFKLFTGQKGRVGTCPLTSRAFKR